MIKRIGAAHKYFFKYCHPELVEGSDALFIVQ